MNLEDQLLSSCPLSVVRWRASPHGWVFYCDGERTTDDGQLTTDDWPLAPAVYSSILRSLSALLITDTELNVMAAAASMGLNSSPNTG